MLSVQYEKKNTTGLFATALPHQGATPVLPFPTTNTESLQLHLNTLRNESSPYVNIATTCLHLNQHASIQNCFDDGDGKILSSILLHDASWIDWTTQVISALAVCCRSHSDRRCRILAIRTCGILSRSLYSRLRPSILLYNQRYPASLGDELSMDVPALLLGLALNDRDDGVSSCSISILGSFILTSSSISETLGDDELLRECMSMTQQQPCSIYSPSLRAICEEDPSIPSLELSMRVLEQSILPRLAQLVDRVVRFTSPMLVLPTLPVLTKALIYLIKTSSHTLFQVERNVYAKRWSEINGMAVLDTFLKELLLPIMQRSIAPVVSSAALSLIRLAAVCPSSPWCYDACHSAAKALLPDADVDIETKRSAIAYSLIALRPLSPIEKLQYLQSVTILLSALPSTISAPAGVWSPGIRVEYQHFCQIRQPSRMGLWAELALSLILDGISDTAISVGVSNRARVLHAFLSTGAMGKILSEQGNAGSTVLYDELLFTFCTVATKVTCRFRSSVDGSPVYTDEKNLFLLEWTQVVGVILGVFAPCVTLRPAKYDDDMSLLTAGQASYTTLLQEYLFPVGVSHTASFISGRLVGNACSSHSLWDQVGISINMKMQMESEPNDILIDGPASQIVDELVSREIQQGILSHPMRLYFLTMATDYWLQGRIASIRKQLNIVSNGMSFSPNLRSASAREIAFALSPKRTLANLLKNQSLVQNDMTRKKQIDSNRGFALETVKACVACIEGIALLSCEWRRRFGPSHETKQLVAVAVGLLQGHLDETPIDDSIRDIAGPVCEAAVVRIQSFYESDTGIGDSGSSEFSIPMSKLVEKAGKANTKPLISNSNPPFIPKERITRYHLMELCRQQVISRTEQALYSVSATNSHRSYMRNSTLLRLTTPSIPHSKDARLLGKLYRPLESWGQAINISSASSDPAALITSFTYRRYVRHDGAEEFRLTVIIRAYNVTPTTFKEGLRLKIAIVSKARDMHEMENQELHEVVQSMRGTNSTNISYDRPLVSSVCTCQHEIKAGDFITWEISLDPSVLVNNAVLTPTLEFNNVTAEGVDVGATWVIGEHKSNNPGDASTCTVSAESKSGEDDFHVTISSDGGRSIYSGNETISESVLLMGDPLSLPSLVGMFPCPMVFFRDTWGDENTFRSFWFSMPHEIIPVKLAPASIKPDNSLFDKQVADMAKLNWQGEVVPGGMATKMWAFSTCRGTHILCLLLEMHSGKSTLPTLHVRGDDPSLLYILTGSKSARESFVAALCPGKSPDA